MKRSLCVLALSAVLLSACGGQQASTGTAATATASAPGGSTTSAGGGRYGPPPGASASTAPVTVAGPTIVKAINFSFQPQGLTVRTGTAVTFDNVDGATHTFTANGGAFDSGRIAPGSSFHFTFGTAGTFAFHCAIHPSMTGTVTVTP